MKIVPVPAHDHRLVAHRGHVSAAGGARAHHDGDLRDSLRRHPRLVEEDAAEVVAVGEDLGLQRQVGAARVDEVEARQAVLLGDLLRAQVLLDREREVGAALHGRVVRDDHALAALDHADAGDDARARSLSVVDLPCCERVQLEERRARVDQAVDPLAREQLAALAVTVDRSLAAAGGDLRGAFAKLFDERLEPCLPAREIIRVLDPALPAAPRPEPNRRSARAFTVAPIDPLRHAVRVTRSSLSARCRGRGGRRRRGRAGCRAR